MIFQTPIVSIDNSKCFVPLITTKTCDQFHKYKFKFNLSDSTIDMIKDPVRP